MRGIPVSLVVVILPYILIKSNISSRGGRFLAVGRVPAGGFCDDALLFSRLRKPKTAEISKLPTCGRSGQDVAVGGMSFAVDRNWLRLVFELSKTPIAFADVVHVRAT